MSISPASYHMQTSPNEFTLQTKPIWKWNQRWERGAENDDTAS